MKIFNELKNSIMRVKMELEVRKVKRFGRFTNLKDVLVIFCGVEKKKSCISMPCFKMACTKAPVFGY